MSSLALMRWLESAPERSGAWLAFTAFDAVVASFCLLGKRSIEQTVPPPADL